jgi:hypothetical protein
MPRILERPYRSPEGTLDIPFVYVFDSSAIADATAQIQNLAVQLQGDSQFVLRRIAGVNLCVDTAANGGKFNYRNPSGSYASGNPSSGIIVGQNWPIVPEKVYTENNAGIFFDLYQTLRSFNVCGGTPIFTSQIAFFGVKRFSKGAGYPTRKTPYTYRECKYGYGFSLTVNWNHFSSGTIIAPPQTFQVVMDRYDFELQRIAITNTTTNASGVGGLITDDFQMMLYDSNLHQFSSLPLNQGFLNSARPTPATSHRYQPALAPTLVYPVGSSIKFDITSMLCNGVGVPQTYNMFFEGLWRVPCGRA